MSSSEEEEEENPYKDCETLAEVVEKYKAEDPEGRDLDLYSHNLDLTGKPPPGDGLRS